jgi:hypothetical protein
VEIKFSTFSRHATKYLQPFQIIKLWKAFRNGSLHASGWKVTKKGRQLSLWRWFSKVRRISHSRARYRSFPSWPGSGMLRGVPASDLERQWKVSLCTRYLVLKLVLATRPLLLTPPWFHRHPKKTYRIPLHRCCNMQVTSYWYWETGTHYWEFRNRSPTLDSWDPADRCRREDRKFLEAHGRAEVSQV